MEGMTTEELKENIMAILKHYLTPDVKVDVKVVYEYRLDSTQPEGYRKVANKLVAEI